MKLGSFKWELDAFEESVKMVLEGKDPSFQNESLILSFWYLYHSREHKILFKMMQKLLESVHWSYNNLKSQPPQHLIVRNQEFSSYSP